MPNVPIKFKPDGVAKTQQAFGKVGGAATKLAKVVGPLVLGAAVFKLGKSAITTAGQFESLKTRLLAMTGSMAKAEKMFKGFNDIAATTPFAVKNVVEAGVQLKAFGLDAEKTIKPVADLAAFMGTDIVDASAAVGRAFAGGAGAADILRERGILQLIKDAEGIEDLSKLTLPEFRKALVSAMTDKDGMIAGATDLLAETWQGKLSNMQDAWSRLMAAIGDKMLPFAKKLADNITVALGDVISFVNEVDWEKTLNLENFKTLMSQTGTAAFNIFSILFGAIDTEAIAAFGRMFTSIGNTVLDFASSLFKPFTLNFLIGILKMKKWFQEMIIDFKGWIKEWVEYFVDSFNKVANETSMLDAIDLGDSLTIDESGVEHTREMLKLMQQDLDALTNQDTEAVGANWAEIKDAILDNLSQIGEGVISYKEQVGTDEDGNADPTGSGAAEGQAEKHQTFMEKHKEMKAAMTDADRKQFEEGKKTAVANLQIAAEQFPKLKKIAKAARIAELMVSIPTSVQLAYESGLKAPFPAPIPMALAVAQATAAAVAGAAQLAQVKAAATGFEGQLNKPTMFLAGERGTENVSVTPLNAPNVRGPQNQGQDRPVNISFEGNVMDENYITEQAIPMIRDAVRRGEVLSD